MLREAKAQCSRSIRRIHNAKLWAAKLSNSKTMKLTTNCWKCTPWIIGSVHHKLLKSKSRYDTQLLLREAKPKAEFKLDSVNKQKIKKRRSRNQNVKEPRAEEPGILKPKSPKWSNKRYDEVLRYTFEVKTEAQKPRRNSVNKEKSKRETAES